MIDDLLEMVGLSHMQCEVLLTLKQFCCNALEVDQLDKKNKEKIVSRLLSIAFADPLDNPDTSDYAKASEIFKERKIAFDIIENLDVRTEPVLDTAMKYVNICLDYPKDYEIRGPDITRVGRWLAKDPKLKAKLIEKAEKLLKEPSDIEFVSLNTRFILDII